MKFSRRRKFHAKWTPDSEGVKHPSKSEAHWFDRLLMRQRAGQITDLEREPTYVIRIAPDCPHCAAHGRELCKVKFDAAYTEAGQRVIVDYKGIEGNTALSKLKRLMVLLRYGVEVELVGPAKAAETRKKIERETKRVVERRARGQIDMEV